MAIIIMPLSEYIVEYSFLFPLVNSSRCIRVIVKNKLARFFMAHGVELSRSHLRRVQYYSLQYCTQHVVT